MLVKCFHKLYVTPFVNIYCTSKFNVPITIELLFSQIWFILQHFYPDYIYQFRNSINITYNILGQTAGITT